MSTYQRLDGVTNVRPRRQALAGPHQSSVTAP